MRMGSGFGCGLRLLSLPAVSGEEWGQVGCPASKPDALSKLECREELWTLEDEIHSQICPEMRKFGDPLQCHLQNQSIQKSVEECCEYVCKYC